MLCWREIVRFFRQRNRVVGAIGQPVLFWLLFSAGFDRSFRLTDSDTVGPSFREYYFPGTLVLILLFTAIFATISIIEDRREDRGEQMNQNKRAGKIVFSKRRADRVGIGQAKRSIETRTKHQPI